MHLTFRLTWLVTVAMLLVATPNSAPAQKGVDEPEAELRGPVHEAFAQPVIRGAGELTMVPQKPPADVPELVPEKMPAGAVWIPGYWGWDETREEFLWVTGTARIPPPDRVWVPGYWDEVKDGWVRVSGYWNETTRRDVELAPAPPDPIAESPPPPPDADSIYAPGCWVYREHRYWWRPGHWIHPRPGWVWIPAGYIPAHGGYVFVDSYWDHDFHHRGLLFAPVRFDAGYFGRPGWSYRPQFALYGDFLLGSLFIHVGSHHYYFGNYYEPRYARLGYQPWLEYRSGERFYDPMFAYYRWNHRGDPGWERDLRASYAARSEGRAAPPPKTVKAALASDAKIVAPLDSFKAPTLKLDSVSVARQTEAVKTADQLRALRDSRRKLERDVKGTGGPGKGAAIKLDLPKLPVAAGPVDRKPPPPPPTPKVLTEPIPGKVAPKLEPPKKDVPKKDVPKKIDPKELTPPKIEPPKIEPPKKPPKIEPPKKDPPLPIKAPKTTPPKSEEKDKGKGKDKDKEKGEGSLAPATWPSQIFDRRWAAYRQEQPWRRLERMPIPLRT